MHWLLELERSQIVAGFGLLSVGCDSSSVLSSVSRECLGRHFGGAPSLCVGINSYGIAGCVPWRPLRIA
jgi:hypothetical protein